MSLASLFPFIKVWWNQPEGMVKPPDFKEKLCPVCGFNYVHIKGVFFFPSGNIAGGVPVHLSTQRDSGRTDIQVGQARFCSITNGESIVIEYFCEDGHHWQESFSFHKGQVREHVAFLYKGKRVREMDGPDDEEELDEEFDPEDEEFDPEDEEFDPELDEEFDPEEEAYDGCDPGGRDDNGCTLHPLPTPRKS